MTNSPLPPPPPEVVAYNERSLQALSRAIALAKGRFSLILVRCNYTSLQQQIQQRLKEICPVAITEMVLHSGTQTLYTAIKTEIGDRQPEALMVLGLDSATALDNVLTATNQVRDEFPKSFAFPLVLWLNDETLKKLARLAPDFNSVAGVPIRFAIAPQDLMQLLQQQTDILFAKTTNAGAGRFPRSSALYDGANAYSRPELKAALKDLQDQQQSLDPALEASLDFVLGLEAYTQNNMEEAQELYQKSLRVWHTLLKQIDVNLRIFGNNFEDKLKNIFRDSTNDTDRDSSGNEFSKSTVISKDVSDLKEQVAIDPKIIPNITSLLEQRSLYVERKACVLFYLGLWWRRQAVLNRAQYEVNCCKARDFHRKCIQTLQEQERSVQGTFLGQKCKDSCSDLIAKFILALGEVLQRLGDLYDEAIRHMSANPTVASDTQPFSLEEYRLKRKATWEELAQVAKTAVELHRSYKDPIRLAYGYGLQAEVALANEQWHQAKQYAEQALLTNAQRPDASPESQKQYRELHWALSHYRSLYLLLLAVAQWHLDKQDLAIENLEAAQKSCNHAYDPLLYTRILQTLQSFYYQREEYLKAFNTKQEQRSIEQQYGIRAFIGAGRLKPERQVINPTLIATDAPEMPDLQSDEFLPPVQPIAVAQEIVAAGRDEDVKQLIERLSRDDYKLTIIHGQSGVGKSSIINAGLVPMLEQQPIGDRNALPILLNVYTDWARELGNRFEEALQKRGFSWTMPDLGDDPKPEVMNKLLVDACRKNGDQRSLLTVLIFDQFEEFFFFHADPLKQRPFFDLFTQCLQLSFVKIVFSLREDYLHYLLECDRHNLPLISNDILGRDKRYPLGNFSRDRAQMVIARLTQRSQFSLKPNLVARLVDDLAKDLDEVRPIELQVVGAELQEKNITTLHEYEKLGDNPKEKLVEDFLAQVVKDCGAEEAQRAARLVLYLLTDEKGTRPLKTRHELSINLSKTDLRLGSQQLDLILEILVNSGIVLLLPEIPAERYQLVHDYLVALVRQNQEPALIEQVSELRKENIELRAQNIQSLHSQRRLAFQVAALGVMLAIFGIAFASLSYFREQQRAIAQLQATTSQSAALLLSHDELGALIASVKAGRQLAAISSVPSPLRFATLAQMQQTLYSIHENNRLVGHSASISDISFSPDGQLLASSSDDYTVRLWKTDGASVRPDGPNNASLKSHTNRVNSVSFSPDGQRLVSASDDGTLKLWQRDGQVLPIALRRPIQIYGVGRPSLRFIQARFSSDGQQIVAASDDGNITFWSRTGEFIKTFSADPERVTAISFSPNGQVLASAGWDGTIKLWDQQSHLQGTLNHQSRVRSLSFSADGQIIASGGADNLIKLWSQDGKLLQTLPGHMEAVTSLSFNQSGSMLVSVSEDAEIKFWRRDPQSANPAFIELSSLRNTGFIRVRFSPSQDNLLALANSDNTIRLWKLDGIPRKSYPLGNTLPYSSSFSPNGEVVAIAGTYSSPQDQDKEGELILLSVKGYQIKRFPTAGRLENIQFSGRGDLLVGAENFSPKSQENGALRTPSGQIKLWNALGELTNSFPIAQTAQDANDGLIIRDIQLSPNEKIIAVAVTKNVVNGIFSNQQTSQIMLFGIDGKLQFAFQPQLQSEITRLSFDTSGETIVSGDNSNAVKVWNLKGNVLATLNEHLSPVTDVEFSPNGRVIASASQDTTIKLWSWTRSNRGKVLRTLRGHIGSVLSLKFSADGKVLASASSDGVIKLWNVESGEALATLQSGDSEIYSLSFSPNGRMLASVGADNAVTLRDFDPNYLFKLSCEWLSDYLRNNPIANQDKGQTICPN